MAASLTFAFNVYIPSDALLFIKYIYMYMYEWRYLFASLFSFFDSQRGGSLSEAFMIMNFTLTS